MLKDITCKYVGKKNTTALEPSKFFFVDPDTGELSQMYDTVEAAEAAAEAVMRKKDETGYTVYVAQVVRLLASERSFKKIEFGAGVRK